MTRLQVSSLKSILKEMHYQLHDLSLDFGKGAPITNYVGALNGILKVTGAVEKGNFNYPAGYWTPVDQLVVRYVSDWAIEVIGVK